MEHSWLSRIIGMSFFVSICIALVISFSARTTTAAPGALPARDAALSSASQEPPAQDIQTQDMQTADGAPAPLAVAVNGARKQPDATDGVTVHRQVLHGRF